MLFIYDKQILPRLRQLQVLCFRGTFQAPSCDSLSTCVFWTASIRSVQKFTRLTLVLFCPEFDLSTKRSKWESGLNNEVGIGITCFRLMPVLWKFSSKFEMPTNSKNAGLSPQPITTVIIAVNKGLVHNVFQQNEWSRILLNRVAVRYTFLVRKYSQPEINPAKIELLTSFNPIYICRVFDCRLFGAR